MMNGGHAMKIGILTGGGDCPGLNPAIRGFVMKALDYKSEVRGVREGWKGLTEDIVEDHPFTITEVEELIRQGGTVLLSSRTNPYKNPEQVQAVKDTIRRHGFDAIVALGGEDTLGVAAKLWKEGVPTVGIPKTMDNDLSETDYTFGFDSAVGVAVETMDRLKDTARSHSRALVLEVMGRHAGWVALYTSIAGGADWVLLPEQPVDISAMCSHLNDLRKRNKRYALIVVSEGVELTSQEDTEEVKYDSFGHPILSQKNIGETVAKLIEERTGWETRSVVIGHAQRGGAPSAFDRVLATRLGIRAAQCVQEHDFGKMVALQGNEIITVPMEKAVGRLRTVPAELFESVSALFNK
jgi:phosphofructokinase-like protein